MLKRLYVLTEVTVPGYIDLMDPVYPTTVWFPGAEGMWQPCVRVTWNDMSYFDTIGDDHRAGGEECEVVLRLKRRKLSDKQVVVGATLDDVPLNLRSVRAY